MKTFLKILLAVVIVAALGFVIYLMLPEEQKMYIQGNIQYRTDDEAKEHVDRLRDIYIPNSSITFGQGLDKLCKSTAWYYEKGTGNDWKVTFYGSKASLDLTTGGLNEVYINKPIEIIFSVRNDSEVDITIYVDGSRESDEAELIIYEKIAAAGNN